MGTVITALILKVDKDSKESDRLPETPVAAWGPEQGDRWQRGAGEHPAGDGPTKLELTLSVLPHNHPRGPV